MNLTQLNYVKAVAQTGSFTLAAEQCYVTQPTLSNGIAQLEQEFEERLFKRTTRKVSLTPFGEHILPFIEKVLNAQSELLRESRTYTSPSQTVIRVGTSPLLQTGWLLSMFEKFRQSYPSVEVILHEQNMADLYRMLDDELLDFVLGVTDSHKASWKGVFLYREQLYFIPEGKTQIDNKKKIRIEDIAAKRFVMVPNDCGLARSTRSLFRSYRKKFNEYSGEALSYQVLEEWAFLGLGAAILPQSKLNLSQKRAVALVDKNERPLTIDFEAVWVNSGNRADHLERFSEFLMEYQETKK